jgi:hypothetical protein
MSNETNFLRASVSEAGTPAPLPQWSNNERGLERVRVYGRASVMAPGGTPQVGRIYDMTREGMTVMLDSRLCVKQVYSLRLSVFHNGQLHNLSVSALFIYEILVRIQGFRHGFQFVTPTDEFIRAVNDILA